MSCNSNNQRLGLLQLCINEIDHIQWNLLIYNSTLPSISILNGTLVGSCL